MTLQVQTRPLRTGATVQGTVTGLATWDQVAAILWLLRRHVAAAEMRDG